MSNPFPKPYQDQPISSILKTGEAYCPFPNSKLGKVKFFQRSHTCIFTYMGKYEAGGAYMIPSPPGPHRGKSLKLFRFWFWKILKIL